MRVTGHRVVGFVLPAVLAAVVGCDSVQPDQAGALVVEAFLNEGQRPSDVILRTTLPLDVTAAGLEASAAREAQVILTLSGETIAFAEIAPGRYAPPDEYDRRLEAGDEFVLRVDWNGSVATASGVIPPRIVLDSVIVNVPLAPVDAILVDSLRRDTLAVDATTGHIYPIETTAWWSVADGPATDPWIQAQLRPQKGFSSVVVDFFLLPEQVFREADARVTAPNALSWTGLYAIPVEQSDSPLPAHALRVAVVRSDRAYADYAIGGLDVDGRGPPSNVRGALGIAAGVSVDSVKVQIDPDARGRRVVVFER